LRSIYDDVHGGVAFHVKRGPASNVGVPRETEEAIRRFAELLLRWNRRINLVSERTIDDLWQRHVADSLQLLPLLPDAPTPLLDLGSGAGFPGLVLAAATGWRTTLVEADKRKAAFLIDAAGRLGLGHVEVHAKRIEDAELSRTRLLTARALAPLPTLLHHAHRLLSPEGGIALFPKGRRAEEELTAASRDWMMRVERFPSRTDPASTIFRISEIRPAGSQA
jgi:16S rRNA (guanine(527)-N(7))-methyltransferase RsmG